MSSAASVETARTDRATADDLFTLEELEELLRCDEPSHDSSIFITEVEPVHVRSAETSFFNQQDASTIAAVPETAEHAALFEAFYRDLDIPLTLSPLFPDQFHMPQTIAVPTKPKPKHKATVLPFQQMNTYALAIAAGMSHGMTLAHWDHCTRSFHFKTDLFDAHWCLPRLVPDFTMGPDWMPYVVADRPTPRVHLAFGTNPPTTLDLSASITMVAQAHIHLACFFRMTGKCISLLPLPKLALSSTEHGPCVDPFQLSLDMLPNMWQHGFYVARIVVSFEHLQQAGALPFAALPSCIATPAFNIAPQAPPKGDRDRVRSIVRQTAMLVAAHAGRQAPAIPSDAIATTR